MILLRYETPDDYKSVQELTAAAFTDSEFGHNGEAELVARLRASSKGCLSLVACSDDSIVGHVLFTPVVIRTAGQEVRGMGLAPLSVTPRRQKSGIGSSLVTEGLDRLFSDGVPFVVVIGHPDYYARFGFRPAAEQGVSHGFTGIPQDVFLIRSNPYETPTAMPGGRVYYLPEFGPQHEAT